MNNKIVIIGGPTASYKSELALKLAKNYNVVIINADSMQIYKELPIISAQPNSLEKELCPHYLYSNIAAITYYSVANWLEECINLINFAHQRNKLPIIVGGTGLYIYALVNGLVEIPNIRNSTKKYCQEQLETQGHFSIYNLLVEVDPTILKKVHNNDKQRILRAFEVYIETGLSIFEHHKRTKPYYNLEQFHYIVSQLKRDDLYSRCNKRIEIMINKGALEEAEDFIKRKFDPKLSIYNTIGIKPLINFFNHSLTLNEAVDFWQQDTRNFAKRQSTWFKNQLPSLKKHIYSCYEDINKISKITI